MEAQITFNNSMLVANGIDYTCPPFKELVKASLDSRFFYSNTSYLWKQVNILDGRSADTTTASPAPEQTSTSSGFVTTVRTTTRGDEKSDGRSADTTTASPAPEQTSTSSGFVTTVRTTTRGGVARITWRLASIIQIPSLLQCSARDVVSAMSTDLQWLVGELRSNDCTHFVLSNVSMNEISACIVMMGGYSRMVKISVYSLSTPMNLH
ncbi:hypothetical protein AHF37_07497 [Paragonimus kellicotti]|nr:hypothetical protein AHF37_07497 [Paragonimus kellicotti]